MAYLQYVNLKIIQQVLMEILTNTQTETPETKHDDNNEKHSEN